MSVLQEGAERAPATRKSGREKRGIIMQRALRNIIAGLPGAVNAAATPSAQGDYFCTWKVENTSSTMIRYGLALRTHPTHAAPLVRPDLPSRLLNGTIVTGYANSAIRSQGIVWFDVTIKTLIPHDPAADKDLSGWVASTGGPHGPAYLRQLGCRRVV